VRRELALGDGPVLGFIGSFYGCEGIDMLVRAMPEILQVYPTTASLVGGGYAEASLKQLATDLGIADKVRFAGRVPHDQVRRYYSGVDVLVYARKSRRLTELVTPLKPLEAMALVRLLGCRRTSRADPAAPTSVRVHTRRCAGPHACDIATARGS
jgi:glycosyltransferase involved in cell wall biosynthesis